MDKTSRNSEVELAVGVYVTNGLRLYEVHDLDEDWAQVINVVTEVLFHFPRSDVEKWEIVVQKCPDSPYSLT